MSYRWIEHAAEVQLEIEASSDVGFRATVVLDV